MLKVLENYTEKDQHQLIFPDSVPGAQNNPKTSLCTVSLELLSSKDKAVKCDLWKQDIVSENIVVEFF